MPALHGDAARAQQRTRRPRRLLLPATARCPLTSAPRTGASKHGHPASRRMARRAPGVHVVVCCAGNRTSREVRWRESPCQRRGRNAPQWLTRAIRPRRTSTPNRRAGGRRPRTGKVTLGGAFADRDLACQRHDARTAATATPTPTRPRSGDRRGCAGACAVTLPGPSVPVRVKPPAPLVVPAPAPDPDRPGVPQSAQPSRRA